MNGRKSAAQGRARVRKGIPDGGEFAVQKRTDGAPIDQTALPLSLQNAREAATATATGVIKPFTDARLHLAEIERAKNAEDPKRQALAEYRLLKSSLEQISLLSQILNGTKGLIKIPFVASALSIPIKITGWRLRRSIKAITSEQQLRENPALKDAVTSHDSEAAEARFILDDRIKTMDVRSLFYGQVELDSVRSKLSLAKLIIFEEMKRLGATDDSIAAALAQLEP